MPVSNRIMLGSRAHPGRLVRGGPRGGGCFFPVVVGATGVLLIDQLGGVRGSRRKVSAVAADGQVVLVDYRYVCLFNVMLLL